jgi:diguanylate cyclase (GGDEF)-like protein
VLLMVLGSAYALVCPRRIAMAVAATTCAAYLVLVSLEAANVLPYAPQGPIWLRGRQASWQSLLGGAVFISLIVLASTYLLARLAERLRRREQELIELSHRDGLTRLHNRRYLDEQLSVQLSRVGRGHKSSLIMIDLDGFKGINDRLGHAVGDDLLREIGALLRETTRRPDVAARYGGDELMILLPDTDIKGAIVLAQRVRRDIADIGQAGRCTGVTASLGVTEFEADDDSRSLLQRADELTYTAKRHSGNQVRSDMRRL